MYVIILAGGDGKRLWPISNQTLPKPFLKIHKDLSLLQNTVLRANRIKNLKKIIIVANQKYIKNVTNECKNLNILSQIEIIVEQDAKNTTAAIAAASLHIECTYGPNQDVLILPCDHIINNESNFYEYIDNLAKVKIDKISLLGIPPTFNNSNYGYIKYSGRKVVSFVEKPSKIDAENYINSGDYLWNSGIIYAKISTLLKEIRKHSPSTWSLSSRAVHNSSISYEYGYTQIKLCSNSTKNILDCSIDYEVLQKSDNLSVIKCDISWREIGDLESYCKIVSSDLFDNNTIGKVDLHNTSNCYIQSKDKHIIMAGVNNLMVVETDDKIFIIDKNTAPNFLSNAAK